METKAPNFWSWASSHIKQIVTIVLLVIIAYANSLANGFVSDDIGAIKENTDINNLSYLVKPPYFNVSSRSVLIFATHYILGDNPSYYRIQNIFFHLGVCIALYYLLGIFFNPNVSFVASLLFSVHPVLTEAVTWVSGGPYVHSAFFILVSLIFYIARSKSHSTKYFILPVIFYYLAISNSEKIIFFPIIIILYELFFDNLAANLKRIIPFVFVSLLWAVYYLSMLPQRMEALTTDFSYSLEIGNQILRVPAVLGLYLKLIFWPINLTFYHAEVNLYGFDLGNITGGVLTIVYILIIIFSIKKNRKLLFWLLFYPVFLGLNLLPFSLSSVIAERYVYLGTIGIIVLIAFLIEKSVKLLKLSFIFTVLTTIIIVFLFVYRTIIRNKDWKNQDTFWIATAVRSTESYQAQYNAGNAYMRLNEPRMAIDKYKRSLLINKEFDEAYYNLGVASQTIKEYDLAIDSYRKALALNPSYVQAHQNIAAIFFLKGKIPDAISEMSLAIRIDPENEILHYNLGIIYLKIGNISSAKELFQEAIAINPNYSEAQKALNNLSGEN